MSENHWKVLKQSLAQLETIASNTEPIAAPSPDVNVIQLGGENISLGVGNSDAGTLRATLASDDLIGSAIVLASQASQAHLENIVNLDTDIQADVNNIDSTIGTFSASIQNTSNKLDSIEALKVNVGLVSALKIAPLDENGNPTHLTCHAGNVADGTLRVTIADNDTNLEILSACVDQANDQIKMNCNALGGNSIATGSGINGTGVQRVTVATDDTLLLNISNKLDSIYNILNDVWNDATNKLRVDTA